MEDQIEALPVTWPSPQEQPKGLKKFTQRVRGLSLANVNHEQEAPPVPKLHPSLGLKQTNTSQPNMPASFMRRLEKREQATSKFFNDGNVEATRANSDTVLGSVAPSTPTATITSSTSSQSGGFSKSTSSPASSARAPESLYTPIPPPTPTTVHATSSSASLTKPEESLYNFIPSPTVSVMPDSPVPEPLKIRKFTGDSLSPLAIKKSTTQTGAQSGQRTHILPDSPTLSQPASINSTPREARTHTHFTTPGTKTHALHSAPFASSPQSASTPPSMLPRGRNCNNVTADQLQMVPDTPTSPLPRQTLPPPPMVVRRGPRMPPPVPTTAELRAKLDESVFDHLPKFPLPPKGHAVPSNTTPSLPIGPQPHPTNNDRYSEERREDLRIHTATLPSGTFQCERTIDDSMTRSIPQDMGLHPAAKNRVVTKYAATGRGKDDDMSLQNKAIHAAPALERQHMLAFPADLDDKRQVSAGPIRSLPTRQQADTIKNNVTTDNIEYDSNDCEMAEILGRREGIERRIHEMKAKRLAEQQAFEVQGPFRQMDDDITAGSSASERGHQHLASNPTPEASLGQSGTPDLIQSPIIAGSGDTISNAPVIHSHHSWNVRKEGETEEEFRDRQHHYAKTLFDLTKEVIEDDNPEQNHILDLSFLETRPDAPGRNTPKPSGRAEIDDYVHMWQNSIPEEHEENSVEPNFHSSGSGESRSTTDPHISGLLHSPLASPTLVASPTEIAFPALVASPTQISCSTLVASPTQSTSSDTVASPTQTASSTQITSPTRITFQIPNKAELSFQKPRVQQAIRIPNNGRSQTNPLPVTEHAKIRPSTELSNPKEQKQKPRIKGFGFLRRSSEKKLPMMDVWDPTRLAKYPVPPSSTTTTGSQSPRDFYDFQSYGVNPPPLVFVKGSDRLRQKYHLPPLIPRTRELKRLHPSHAFPWETQKLFCTVHEASCASCKTECCGYRKAEREVHLSPSDIDPKLQSAAWDMINVLNQRAPHGLDAFPRMLRCSTCRRLVCPACAGRCENGICTPIRCKDCAGGDPWKVCSCSYKTGGTNTKSPPTL